MSETLVAEPRSAAILAFPARPLRDDPAPARSDAEGRPVSAELTELRPAPRKADAPGAVDPNERLRIALANLDAALAAQRIALADWRGALTDLHGSLGGLGTSLQGYNAALGELAVGVSKLNQQARTLEATADAALLAVAPPA